VPTDVALLQVVRNGYVESSHLGRFVLLATDGSTAVTAGAPDEPVLPRSALKPVQAIALLENGFTAPDDAVALSAASHNGEPMHVDLATAVLAGAGLDERALQCPAQLPDLTDAMLARVMAGGGPSRLCHNCSGKHAAMLATCVARDWPTATYLDPEHPLQVAIRDTVARYTDAELPAPAVDGCGAPAHRLSLVALARAFARIATAPEGTTAARVRDAMHAHPLLVGGTGRPVTELTTAVPGLLAKDGAEGVWAAALPDGRAFAAKTADGSARTLGPLLSAALRYWGVDDPVVDRWAETPVLGGGVPVGAVRPAPELLELLLP
jgi:L-asparaginase II